MRKGALKKKQRQLEELHLDRREALGELALGMFVQNSWDENLLAKGASEVGEVEAEIARLNAEESSSAPDSAEMDFPPTGEHTGQFTVEHDFPATGEHTGEYTAEHVLPPPKDEKLAAFQTAEHSLPPETGEHTGEHAVPATDEATAVHSAPVKEPKLDRKSRKKQKAEEKAQAAEATQAPEGAPAAATGAAVPPQPDAKPATPAAKSSTPAAPAPEAPSVGGAAAAGAGARATGAAAASTPSAGTPAASTPAAGAAASIPTPAAAATPPVPERPKEPSRLDVLAASLEKSETEARTAAEAAKATAQTEVRTELSAITREVESEKKKLDESLAVAGKAIADANAKVEAMEKKLARETAANREAAAVWVREQSAEIEADAALAAEMVAPPEPATSAAPPPPGSGALNAPAVAAGAVDANLQSRLVELETELAAEKASKAAALGEAEKRLREIEASALAAEEKVKAAEASLAQAPEAAAIAAPVAQSPAEHDAAEARAREAAASWLRGQIAALRQELAKQNNSSGEGTS